MSMKDGFEIIMGGAAGRCEVCGEPARVLRVELFGRTHDLPQRTCSDACVAELERRRVSREARTYAREVLTAAGFERAQIDRARRVARHITRTTGLAARPRVGERCAAHISGARGSGKTTLAIVELARMAGEAYREGRRITARYVTELELYESLKPHCDRLSEYTAPDVLIVDDVGVARTERDADLWHAVYDARYRAWRTTITMSEESAHELASRGYIAWPTAVIGRLVEMGRGEHAVELGDSDKRHDAAMRGKK